MGEFVDKAKSVGNDIAGKAKEAAGAVTGDRSLEAKGEAQQAKADAQWAKGEVKGALGDDV